VTVNLVALRRLNGGDDTDALRHYILGLTLVAATADVDGFLRSGCQLVSDPDAPAQWNSVARDGTREVVVLDHETAIDYATAACKNFGIKKRRYKVTFDKTRAQKDIEEEA